MSRFLHVLKEKWKLILLLAFVLGILVYLFIPRNLATLADVYDTDVEGVSFFCYPPADAAKNFDRITLTEAESQELLEIMKRTYVYRNPIELKYSNDPDFGYFFEFARKPSSGDRVPPLVHYFTEEIISVNGIQYRFYGNEFEEWFKALVDRD